MSDDDVKGSISTISFATTGGDPFDVAVTGMSGSVVSFSSDSSCVTAPSTSTIPSNGLLVVTTYTNPVAVDTVVTLTATTTGLDGPQHVPLLIHVQSLMPFIG